MNKVSELMEFLLAAADKSRARAAATVDMIEDPSICTMEDLMNKKVVIIDDYDIVELHAAGSVVLKVKWNKETHSVEQLISGPMAFMADLSRLTPEELAELTAPQPPGIITCLKKEGLLNE